MNESTTIRAVLAFVFLCVVTSSFSTVLHASERHALIIGNSDYNTKRLNNPRNDALDMEAQLRSMGYQIYGGSPAFDLDRIGIERTARSFARSLPENAQSIFYYAGHGLSTRKDNYLVPINHNLQYLEQLPDKAVSLRSIVDLLKNANADGMNVLILDACRDSPLESSYRGDSKGLQKLYDIPKGVFIGYAADTGQVAEDGKGRNGTYTGELLNVMQEMPNVIIEVAHKEVANRVFDKTGGRQFPVSENKIYGDWCFGTCTNPMNLGNTENPYNNVEPAPVASASSKSMNWKVIGGIALGVLVVGAAMQGDDDKPQGRSLDLVVEPPQ